MADACPVAALDAPLVRSLLSTTDCHVQGLVRGGYAALFESSGAFSAVLTTLLTIYVALLGYRLLLGRTQLGVGEFALTAVKIGAVVALATQWGTYEALVYRFLFEGPRQVADVVLQSLGAHGATSGGDVFEGLQRAFDDLTTFSPASPPGAPVQAAGATTPAVQASAFLGKPGFDSILLMGSAVVLLVSSLGLLLAAKIVLGLLLALGPVFIALLLFDSTRGLFEGWLRASLGFAFAPVAVTLLLGLALTLLEPSLQAIEAMRDQHVYTSGVAFGVAVLVLVFAGVAAGMALAGGVVAGGLQLPRALQPSSTAAGATTSVFNARTQEAALGRSARVAAAAVALDRRDASSSALIIGTTVTEADRRIPVVAGVARAGRDQVALEVRLGQGPRRSAAPRTGRGGVRSSR